MFDIIASVIAFLICAFLTRWIFRIDTIIEYQKKQYLLLKEIAIKEGIDKDRIKTIDNPDWNNDLGFIDLKERSSAFPENES